MTTTGLRELQQNASELIRRVEAGETITVTVSGRPVALLYPVDRRQWRSGVNLAELLGAFNDHDWDQDRGKVDHMIRDPFDRS